MSRSFLVLMIITAIFIGLSPVPTHAKHTYTSDLTIGTNIVSLQPSFTLQLGTAETVTWHPTQEKLAVGGSYGITIYDSAFNVIHELRNPRINSLYLTWSPDGSQIAVSSPSFIAIWNVDSESLDQMIYTDFVRSITWSPGGQYIAGIDGDSIGIVDLSVGDVTITLDSDGNLINSIDWGPSQGIQDSYQIASESRDGIIRIWDINIGTVAQIYEQSGLLLRSVAWNHNTYQIASVSDTFDIYLWDVTTQSISKTFSAEAVGWITQFQWLPDDQLLSISLEGRIDIWDIADEQPQPMLVTTWETNYWTEVFDINSLGTKFAGINRQRQIPTRDNIIWIRELPSGQTITSLLNYGDAVTTLSWDSQSRQLVSGSFDMYLRLWDTNNGALYVRTSLPPWTTWSLNESWDYISSFNENGEFQTIWAWDQSLNTLFENPPSAPITDITLTELVELDRPNARTSALLWVSSTRLVNLTERGTLLVWENNNGWQITNTFNSDIALSIAASVSPNGSYIAISGFDLNDDPILQVFDIQMGTLTTVVQATNYAFGPVVWNFDSTLLATNGENGVNIWDWDAPIPLVDTLEKSDAFDVRALAWHPSRNMLAGATSTIWLWDINTTSLLTSIETNQNITTIAWSPDAQKLAVGGFDGSLVIFTIND